MTKTRRETIRYSNRFKLQVVEEIEKGGLSIRTAERVNGILEGEFYLGSTFRDFRQSLSMVCSAIRT